MYPIYECVQMWPGLVQLAKEGGINTIETYVFWNGHELSPNNVGLSALLVFLCLPLSFGEINYQLCFFFVAVLLWGEV